MILQDDFSILLMGKLEFIWLVMLPEIILLRRIKEPVCPLRGRAVTEVGPKHKSRADGIFTALSPEPESRRELLSGGK